MARPLRLQLAGSWYHVVSRGNGGEVIFRGDTDRRRFLGLVSELPGRFAFEVHAFVLMDNHYHLLLRTGKANLSDGIRWLNVTYTMRFNWSHSRHGHLLQGRFKAALIRDESRLNEVARYLHLNPVRVGALGLGKEDRRRSRVTGRGDPGADLVARRLRKLREHRWSSWAIYSGAEAKPAWLETGRLAGGCGGRSRRDQIRALRQYTEEPIREGRMDSPWEGLVGGVVLGEKADALALFKAARSRPAEQTAARRIRRLERAGWRELIEAAETASGRKWEEMSRRHGDWGRDAVLAVAVRHLGWRLPDLLRQIPELTYNAAAQGVRRFWREAPRDAARAEFAVKLRKQLSKI